MEEDCLGMASPQAGAAVPPPATARHHHPGAQEDHHQLVLNMEHRRLQPYQVMEAQVQLLLQVVARLSSSH